MQLSAALPAQFHQALHRVGRAVVDGMLPPRCLACGATVDEPDALCPKCWTAMTFFAPPWCAMCGHVYPLLRPAKKGDSSAFAVEENWDGYLLMVADRHPIYQE